MDDDELRVSEALKNQLEHSLRMRSLKLFWRVIESLN